MRSSVVSSISFKAPARLLRLLLKLRRLAAEPPQIVCRIHEKIV
jgi:hypothetical protein